MHGIDNTSMMRKIMMMILLAGTTTITKISAFTTTTSFRILGRTMGTKTTTTGRFQKMSSWGLSSSLSSSKTDNNNESHSDNNNNPHYESIFLDQVEETVHRVFDRYNENDTTVDIMNLPPSEREPLMVARYLHDRIAAMKRQNFCRRCWLQVKNNCVCSACPSLESESTPSLFPIKRLFLLTHHKEIGLSVDTAKFLLSSFPQTSRLVVGGIPSEYQSSMKELEEALSKNTCLVLFPTENAITYSDLVKEQLEEATSTTTTTTNDNGASPPPPPDGGWDVIVMDGTWAQARKLYTRYIKDNNDSSSEQKDDTERRIRHIQLSDEAVATLGTNDDDDDDNNNDLHSGHQLRKHPIRWRQVSTLEATRLLLNDIMMISSSSSPNSNAIDINALSTYQQIGNAAARRQLGPKRSSPYYFKKQKK